MQSDVWHKKRPFFGALSLPIFLDSDGLGYIVVFVIIENVQIHGTGTKALRAFHPAEPRFNLLEAREEGHGREGRLEPANSVEEIGLLGHVLGFGFVEARGGLDVAEGGLRVWRGWAEGRGGEVLEECLCVFVSGKGRDQTTIQPALTSFSASMARFRFCARSPRLLPSAT